MAEESPVMKNARLYREANEKFKKKLGKHVKPTEDMTDDDYLELMIGDGEKPLQRALRALKNKK